jgi:hypothetical protein
MVKLHYMLGYQAGQVGERAMVTCCGEQVSKGVAAFRQQERQGVVYLTGVSQTGTMQLAASRAS